MENEVISAVINKIIGPRGRMISRSKMSPKGHECVWNGNIIVDGQKIWFGDLDLTKDEKKLQKCADTIKKPLYILREMDARFDKEKNPDLSKAIKVFTHL